MLRRLSIFSFCFLLACVCYSSPIDQGLNQNWVSKKFRAAIRRAQAQGDLKATSKKKRENYLHMAVRLNRPLHLSLLLQTEEMQQMYRRRNHDAQTAIELALFLGHTDCFLELLPYLRNPNMRIPNTYRWTLVQLAARYNRALEIRALAIRGADLTATDETAERWTALDIARRANALDAVAVLEELTQTAQLPQQVAHNVRNETERFIVPTEMELEDPPRSEIVLALPLTPTHVPFETEEDELQHALAANHVEENASDFVLAPMVWRIGMVATLFFLLFGNPNFFNGNAQASR